MRDLGASREGQERGYDKVTLSFRWFDVAQNTYCRIVCACEEHAYNRKRRQYGHRVGSLSLTRVVPDHYRTDYSKKKN